MMKLDVSQIQEVIPHRYPFLLVDQIIELAESRVVGIKNVTINESFFQGHFPQYAVMPGVLIIEALAQIGAVLVLGKEENRGKLAFFAGIDKVRFRGQVKPGDVLRLELEMLKLKANMGKGKGIAYVGDKLVAEGELMFAISTG
jgi:3-hydroxyacyl-[acyl-carrier-protein] dehydratase